MKIPTALKPKFSFERTARDGGRIRLGRTVIAEIRRLELFNFRPVRGAGPLVGNEVGIPLYWRQYGNHQDPERSVHSHRRLALELNAGNLMCLHADAHTRSRSVHSRHMVVFKLLEDGRIRFGVAAYLQVEAESGWRVTSHPDHGEVTYCTLWPAGVFAPDGRTPKRFQSCLVQRGANGERIAHHHLGSPDKHRIELGRGDRFAWVLEDINPVFTCEDFRPTEAGVCAYMWDVHFGLRVCPDESDAVMCRESLLQASYSLTAATREELAPLVRRARWRSAGAAVDTPVWTGGRHTFAKTFRGPGIAGNTAWPWETAVTGGPAAAVQFARDTRVGCTDRFSLRIRSAQTVQAAWQATTLGPAFGERAFRRGGCLRLTAWVRTRDLRGEVTLALRVHRTGRGSVFDGETYETHVSPVVRAADQDWLELIVTTPAITPAPDRVHVLLQLNGKGTVWFDDVEFRRLP